MKKAIGLVFPALICCILFVGDMKAIKGTPHKFLNEFYHAMSDEAKEGDPLKGYYFQKVTEIYVRYEQQYSEHSYVWVIDESSTSDSYDTVGEGIKYRLSKKIYPHILSDIKGGTYNPNELLLDVSYEVYPPLLERGVVLKNKIKDLSQYFFNLFDAIETTSTSKDHGVISKIIRYPDGNFMFLDCYPNAVYPNEVYGAALYVKKCGDKYYLDTTYYFAPRIEYP